jgi:pimeloyl-ACP methyl ester carboxylesterase
MKVYFFSGIAADRRAFKHIHMPAGFDAVYIDWISPLINESLSEYAMRLAEKINKEEPFCLVGLSLGGIIASEIAVRYHPHFTIIIGSVPVCSQLPSYYKWARRLKVHRLLPGSLYKNAAFVKHFFTREAPEDKKDIYRMLRAADPSFIRWGIHAVLNWANNEMPKSLTHIHGTRDEVFPFAFTSPTHVISKGDHMLVISHPEEINRIIAERLSDRDIQ